MSKNRNNNSNNAAGSILYGRHPVMAVLNNPRRRVSKILCTKDNFDEIKAVCQQNKINTGIINTVDKKEIDRVLPRDAVHQGFAVYCSELEDYSLEDICIMADQKNRCHILILDQVTDPQNIGAIIRSCVAFDTLALILPVSYTHLTLPTIGG